MYLELVGRRARVRLVVLGMELEGRWSAEAWTFVRLLARARAREEPEGQQTQAAAAWRGRWTAALAVASQRALAESLLDMPGLHGADGPVPTTQVLEDARYALLV